MDIIGVGKLLVPMSAFCLCASSIRACRRRGSTCGACCRNFRHGQRLPGAGRPRRDDGHWFGKPGAD
jgi:hypothetical protein